jgi:PPM family protein phosphatase
MTMESHGVTHAGLVRSENQDRILVLPELGCYIVCDGMGGQRCGELAAEIAIEVLQHYIECSRNPSEVTWPFGYNMTLSLDANRLFTSIRLANRQVTRRSEEDLQCSGMGSTVVAVLCRGNRAAMASVGDSRVYRFRGGALEQLTSDDTMAGLMLGKGIITVEGAAVHPMRSILTQALGSQADVEAHVRDEELLEGDILLLCSDGLYNAVDHPGIIETLSTPAPVEGCAQALLDRALAAGASDNVSVILLRYGVTTLL